MVNLLSFRPPLVFYKPNLEKYIFNALPDSFSNSVFKHFTRMFERPINFTLISGFGTKVLPAS